MTINILKVKTIATLTLLPFLGAVVFYVGVQMGGLIYGLIYLFVGAILLMFIGRLLLRNPFTMMLEGRGILAINLDSTGILRPFIVSVQSPWIKFKQGKSIIRDVFNRNTIFNMAVPVASGSAAEQKAGGGLKYDLSEEDYNKGRFAMFHYPVLIWNDQTQCFVTKDFLASKETGAFSEHILLNTNRQLEELTAKIRDFSRYIVEQIRPMRSILSSPWTWVIIGVALVVILILFAPGIVNSIKTGIGTASNTPILPSGITPR